MRIRVILLALLATGLTAAPAAAWEPEWDPPTPRWSAGHALEVAGVRLLGLPAALGEPQRFESVGDGGERVSTVVWERRRGDGWEVHGAVTMIRAPWLRDPEAAYAWFTRWQQRPSEEAVYDAVTLIGGAPAWLAQDQIIWQPRPGMVASVTLHRHLARPDLLRSIAASSPAGPWSAHGG